MEHQLNETNGMVDLTSDHHEPEGNNWNGGSQIGQMLIRIMRHLETEENQSIFTLSGISAVDGTIEPAYRSEGEAVQHEHVVSSVSTRLINTVYPFELKDCIHDGWELESFSENVDISELDDERWLEENVLHVSYVNGNEEDYSESNRITALPENIILIRLIRDFSREYKHPFSLQIIWSSKYSWSGLKEHLEDDTYDFDFKHEVIMLNIHMRDEGIDDKMIDNETDEVIDEVVDDTTIDTEEDDVFSEAIDDTEEDEVFSEVTDYIEEGEVFSEDIEEDEVFSEAIYDTEEDEVFSEASDDIEEGEVFSETIDDTEEDEAFSEASYDTEEDEVFSESFDDNEEGEVFSEDIDEDEVFSEAIYDTEEDEGFSEASDDIEEGEVFSETIDDIEEDEVFGEAIYDTEEDEAFSEASYDAEEDEVFSDATVDATIDTETDDVMVVDTESDDMMVYTESDENIDNAMRASEVVNDLPTVIISEDNGDALLCVICHDPIPIGESAKQLPCSHLYHSHCILQWFRERLTCPICRHKSASN
jgi:hypothetical protein